MSGIEYDSQSWVHGDEVLLITRDAVSTSLAAIGVDAEVITKALSEIGYYVGDLNTNYPEHKPEEYADSGCLTKYPCGCIVCSAANPKLCLNDCNRKGRLTNNDN